MPTVIDEATGEEIEVQPVEAVAALVSVSAMAARKEDLPLSNSRRIENAMCAAAAAAMQLGKQDPDEIRNEMLKARDREQIIMRNEEIDRRSQEAAEQK